MTLASLIDGQLAYGLTPLLDRASLTILAGERVGLIGRNGTGKSSLLGVIARRVALEEGELHWRDGLHIATVVAENRVNMSSLEVHVYDDKTAVVSTTVEIDSLAQLSRLMEKLEGVKDVHTVAREAS